MSTQSIVPHWEGERIPLKRCALRKTSLKQGKKKKIYLPRVYRKHTIYCSSMSNTKQIGRVADCLACTLPFILTVQEHKLIHIAPEKPCRLHAGNASLIKKTFYWDITAFQCCVRFCCTLKWVSHMNTYIPSLLDLPPTSPSSHPSRASRSTELHSLCFPLAVYFTHWCVCVSHSLPTHPILSFPPCAHKSDF